MSSHAGHNILLTLLPCKTFWRILLDSAGKWDPFPAMHYYKEGLYAALHVKYLYRNMADEFLKEEKMYLSKKIKILLYDCTYCINLGYCLKREAVERPIRVA